MNKWLLNTTVLALITSSTAFAQKAIVIDECGSLEDGIARSQELANWQPHSLQGDEMNWYYNLNNRVQAALIKAKINNGVANEEEKAALQKMVDSLCGSLD